MRFRKHFIFFVIALAAIGCEMMIPEGLEEDQLLDGPVDGMTDAENKRFLAGDIAFNDEIFTTETGLGPLFVATSCGSCHPGDGKGHPITTLTRFGQSDATGNQYLKLGGPQLQHRAIPGFVPEVVPAGITFSKFTPPANTGLGYLAALTDDQILAHADPNDADGDGISGVPNYITPPAYFQQQWFHREVDGKIIGRFGKKAAAIDLLHQTVNAYNQDIGITSVYDPIDTYTGQATDSEVSEQTIQDVVFYLRTLKAPIQRQQDQSEIVNGKMIFTNIGCGSCHRSEWTTPVSDVAALSNRTFAPYTDLLLHDMGPGLDDGYTEGTATTAEWRTPALWGLGLSPKSQGGTYYLLHDGRARSIQEAIQLHGGEGAASRERFAQLPQTDRDALIKFLESL